MGEEVQLSGTAFKDIKDLSRNNQRKKGSAKNVFPLSLVDRINNTRLEIQQVKLGLKIRKLT